MRKLLFLSLLVFAVAVFGATASLYWDAPTTRVDGTALTASEIANYDLCIGATINECAELRSVPASSTTIPIESLDLNYGQWYFKLRTVDTNGLMSSWSEPVEHFIQAPPNPPAGLRVE